MSRLSRVPGLRLCPLLVRDPRRTLSQRAPAGGLVQHPLRHAPGGRARHVRRRGRRRARVCEWDERTLWRRLDGRGVCGREHFDVFAARAVALGPETAF